MHTWLSNFRWYRRWCGGKWYLTSDIVRATIVGYAPMEWSQDDPREKQGIMPFAEESYE